MNFIDDDDKENLCTMIIALMQKDTRQRRIRGLEGEDYVQFRVFKVSSLNCSMLSCPTKVLVQQESLLVDEYRELNAIYH